MNPRTALIIGAVAAFAFGVPLFVVPASVLASAGLAASDVTTSLSRGAGATLIGLGVIDWMARGAAGRERERRHRRTPATAGGERLADPPDSRRGLRSRHERRALIGAV